jgi:hypothetical protein
MHCVPILHIPLHMASLSEPDHSVLYPTLFQLGWKSLEELNKKLEPLSLYLNSPEPAILCRTCKYALKPSETSNTITRHLSKHNISLLQHKQLADFIRTIRLPDPKSLPPRPDGSPRHPFLADRKGVICSHCGYRTTSTDLFKRHVKKQHQGASRKARKQIALHWERDNGTFGISLQTWTENCSSGFWAIKSLQGDMVAVSDGDMRVATLRFLNYMLSMLHLNLKPRLDI